MRHGLLGRCFRPAMLVHALHMRTSLSCHLDLMVRCCGYHEVGLGSLATEGVVRGLQEEEPSMAPLTTPLRKALVTIAVAAGIREAEKDAASSHDHPAD